MAKPLDEVRERTRPSRVTYKSPVFSGYTQGGVDSDQHGAGIRVAACEPHQTRQCPGASWGRQHFPRPDVCDPDGPLADLLTPICGNEDGWCAGWQRSGHRHPSAVPRLKIRSIGELVSSRESFMPEEVHRTTHRRGTRGLSTDGPQAQRQPREGAPRADSLAGRCGRAGADRSADRRRRSVPHQDGREHSPTIRAGRVRAGAGTQTARVSAGPELLDGEQEARIIALRLGPPPKGYANWSLRLLAHRVVELAMVESVSHETIRRTLKKTG